MAIEQPGSIYVIGSLRNPEIPLVSAELRRVGLNVFDDWYAAGPRADDSWRAYEQGRGRSYIEALRGHAASHVFNFDFEHLQRVTAAVLVLPAGKSAHMELGWVLGQGKVGYVLLDNPDRWDVMYQLATEVFTNVDNLTRTAAQLVPRPKMSVLR